MSPKLLTRDQFREGVFARDRHKCVLCEAMAQDAHHILERRLFPDSGYYLDNGASVCGPCHIECEKTNISCDRLREIIGIKTPVLPPHFYSDVTYDKWGNIVLPDGKRLRGELFDDPSVQKILSEKLPDFVNYVKYPRTWHLPWSENVKKDDRIIESLEQFVGKRVIVTVKQDGENTTMYPDYLHARSINSGSHPSRNWVKSLHGKISSNIPDGFRVCGENLYAKHSIHYQNLTSYFQMFSIWNEQNMCHSWDETKEWSALLGLELVPVLYDGIWNEKLIKSFNLKLYEGNECEGYVVRLANQFSYRDFKTSVAKFVRKDHVQTHGHWMRSQLVVNGLK